MNENEEKSRTRRSNDREGTAETRPARKEDGDDDDLRRRITANRRGTTEVMIRNIPSDWNWYDLKAYIIKHISFLSLYKSPSEEIGSVICKNKSVAMKLIEKIDDKPPYYLEAFLSSDDVEETEMNPDLEEGEREDSPYEYEDLRSKLNNRRIQDFGGYYAPDEDRRYSYEDKRYPRKRSPLRPAFHEGSSTHYPYGYEEHFRGEDYPEERRRNHPDNREEPWRLSSSRDARRGHYHTRSESPGISVGENFTITVRNEEKSPPLAEEDTEAEVEAIEGYLSKEIEQTNAFLEECSSIIQSIEMAGKDKIIPIIIGSSFFEKGFDQVERQREDHKEERHKSRSDESYRYHGSAYKRKHENSVSPPSRRQRLSVDHRSKSPYNRRSRNSREHDRSLEMKIRSPIKHQSESRRRLSPSRHDGPSDRRSRSPRYNRPLSGKRSPVRSEESPIRRPVRRSRSRSPRRRANPIMDYMQDLETMKKRHANNWKAFEAEPDKHPLYKDEFRCWQKINYHLNESSQQWIDFWKNKAAEWKANELNDMKLSLQKKYRVDRTPSPTLLASIAKEDFLDQSRVRSRSPSPNYRNKEYRYQNRRHAPQMEGDSRRSRSNPRYNRTEQHYKEERRRPIDREEKKRSLDRERRSLEYKRTRSPSLEKDPRNSVKYRKEGSRELQERYRRSPRKGSLEALAKTWSSSERGTRRSSSQKRAPVNLYDKERKSHDFEDIVSARQYPRRTHELEDLHSGTKIKEEPKDKPSKKSKENKKSKSKSKDVAKNLLVKDPVVKETSHNLKNTLFFLCDDKSPKQNKLLPEFQKLLKNVANGFPRLMSTAISMEAKKKNFSNSLLQEEEVRSFLTELSRNLDKISDSSSLTPIMSGITTLVSHNLGSLLEISSKDKRAPKDIMSRKEIISMAKSTLGMNTNDTIQEIAKKLVACGQTNVHQSKWRNVLWQVFEAQKNLQQNQGECSVRGSFNEDSDSSSSSDSSLGSVCRDDISKLKEQFLSSPSGHGSRETRAILNREEFSKNEHRFMPESQASPNRAHTMEEFKKRVKVEPSKNDLLLPPPPPQISSDPSFQEVLHRSPTPSSEDDWSFERRSAGNRSRARKKSESPELYSDLDSPPRPEPDSSSTRLLAVKTEPLPKQQRTDRDFGQIDPPPRSTFTQNDNCYSFPISSGTSANGNSLQSRSFAPPTESSLKSVAKSDSQQDIKPVFLRPVSTTSPQPSQAAPPQPVPPPRLSSPFVQNKVSSQLRPVSAFQQTKFPPQPVPPPSQTMLPFSQSSPLPIPPPLNTAPQPVPPPNQKSAPQFSLFSQKYSLGSAKPVPVKEEFRQHADFISDESLKKETKERYSRSTPENESCGSASNYNRNSIHVEHPCDTFSTSKFKSDISPNAISTRSLSDQLLLKRERIDECSKTDTGSTEGKHCETLSIPFLDSSSHKPSTTLEKKPLKGILKKSITKDAEPESDPDFDYLYNSDEPALPSFEQSENQTEKPINQTSRTAIAQDDVSDYLYGSEEPAEHKGYKKSTVASPSTSQFSRRHRNPANSPSKRPEACRSLNETVSAILDSTKSSAAKPNENTKDIVSKLMAMLAKK